MLILEVNLWFTSLIDVGLLDKELGTPDRGGGYTRDRQWLVFQMRVGIVTCLPISLFFACLSIPFSLSLFRKQ